MWRNVLYTSFVVIAGLVAHTEASCGISAIASCSISPSEMGTSTTSICRAFRKFKTCMLGLTQCDATSYIHAYENKPDLSGKTFKTMCANVAFSDTTTASAVHCETNEMYDCSNTVVTAVDGANGNTNTICAAAESYAQCLKKQTCKTDPIYLQALVTITSRNLSRTCPDVVFPDSSTPTTTTGAGSTTPGPDVVFPDSSTPTTTTGAGSTTPGPDVVFPDSSTPTTTTGAGSTTPASITHCDVNEMYACSAAVVAAVDTPNAPTNTICTAAEIYVECLKKQTCKTNSVYLQALRTITAKNLDTTCPAVVFPTTDSAGTARSGVVCLLAVLLALLAR